MEVAGELATAVPKSDARNLRFSTIKYHRTRDVITACMYLQITAIVHT
jgi:hypothetical protein